MSTILFMPQCVYPTPGAHLLTWLILMPVWIWINDHMPTKVWDEIDYPFPNFNGCTVEVLGIDK